MKIDVSVENRDQSQQPPLLLIPTATSEVPRPQTGLIIVRKGSQNSLKAVTLAVIVYYREKIQITISQEMPGAQLKKAPHAELPVVLSQLLHGQC